MSKDLKQLSKITTRYKNRIDEWTDTSFKSLPKRWSKSMNDTRDGLTELERKEAITNPINQKHDFKKPTLVNMTRDEIQILVNTGRIEVGGITIIYEK